VDTIDNEGEYGDGGPDSRSGFKSYAVYDSKGRALFDSLNSDAIEVSEEYSDDESGGGHYAWDAVAEANMRLAAAAPDLLAAVREYMEIMRYADDKQALIAGIRRADELARAAVAKATGTP
jgi:hypothetical protein